MKRGIMLCLLIAAAGCVSTTPEGSKVRLTRNSQATAGCKFIANVSAGNGMGDVENRLKNEAAKVGGDLVFLDSTSLKENPFLAHAEAYRCEGTAPKQ